MTTIKLSGNRFTAKGHAEYANTGEDIVCAAISILCELFAESLYQYSSEGLLRDMEATIEPGNVVLTWKMRKESEEFTGVLRAIQNGFALLAESYPENVEFEDLT